MTEDQLEQETLGWLKSLDYDYRFGPDIAFDTINDEVELNARLQGVQTLQFERLKQGSVAL